MKINNITNNQLQRGNIHKNSENKTDNKNSVKNQDLITIQSNKINDKKQDEFIVSLKNKIMADVKKETNQEKLKQIKEQVLLKEYEINPADIARKIIK